MHYDSYKALIKTYDNGYQFAEKDSVLAKFSSIELPDESERRESFIVSENEQLKPSIISDSLGLFKFAETEKEESDARKSFLYFLWKCIYDFFQNLQVFYDEATVYYNNEIIQN